jgi:single-strand DNA-binding protein
MPNLNSVHLIGNCTRDPELRYTPNGTAICDIGVAINRSYTSDDGQKREDTTFVDVTLWARVAEIAAQYLKKGAPVFIDGRLQLDTWDDKQTGQKRTKLKVVGENIQFLGARPQSEAGPSSPSQPARTPAPAPSARPAAPRDPDLDVEPDDIPF